MSREGEIAEDVKANSQVTHDSAASTMLDQVLKEMAKNPAGNGKNDGATARPVDETTKAKIESTITKDLPKALIQSDGSIKFN